MKMFSGISPDNIATRKTPGSIAPAWPGDHSQVQHDARAQ